MRKSATKVSCTSIAPGCGRYPTGSQTSSVRPSPHRQRRVTPRGRTRLVTVNQSKDTLQKVLDSYREAGGRGSARLQIHLSWAPTDDEALAIAHDQWRSNVFAPPACWDVETVDTFDVISEDVSPEQVRKSVNVSSDLGQARGVARRSTSSRDGMRSICTSWVSSRRPSSKHSVNTFCPSWRRPPPSRKPRSHETGRHRRSVVEERGLLLRGRRDLLRLDGMARETSAA